MRTFRILSVAIAIILILVTFVCFFSYTNTYDMSKGIIYESLKKTWELDFIEYDYRGSVIISHEMVVYSQRYLTDIKLTKISLETGNIEWEKFIKFDFWYILDYDENRTIIAGGDSSRDDYEGKSLLIIKSSNGEIVSNIKLINNKSNIELVSGKIIEYNQDHLNCYDELSGKYLWSFEKEYLKDNIKALNGIDEKLFIITSIDNMLYCLNINTGKVIWVFKYPDKQCFIESVIYKKSLYALSALGVVYKLNIQNGKCIFQREFYLGKRVPNNYFQSKNLVVSDGKIYFFPFEILYCLDAETGKVYWQFAIEYSDLKNLHISILPHVYEGKVFFSSVVTLYCLDNSTGKLIWKFDTMTDKEFKNRRVFTKTYWTIGLTQDYGGEYTKFYNSLVDAGGSLDRVLEINDKEIFVVATKNNRNTIVTTLKDNLYCLNIRTGRQKYLIEAMNVDNSFDIISKDKWNNENRILTTNFRDLYCVKLPSDAQPSLDPSK